MAHRLGQLPTISVTKDLNLHQAAEGFVKKMAFGRQVLQPAGVSHSEEKLYTLDRHHLNLFDSQLNKMLHVLMHGTISFHKVCFFGFGVH